MYGKEATRNEKFRKKEQEIVNESQTLVIEKKQRKGRSKNRGPYNRNNKSRGRFKLQKNDACFYCKKKGHYMKECRILK